MAFARKALMPRVSNGRAFISNQRDHAPKKKIHFAIKCQRIKRALAHESIVCMVVHSLNSHKVQQPIESLSSRTLEGSVA